MAENKNIPEIRFDGFIDAWEQRKLGELCTEFKSGDFISAQEIEVSGPYPVYGGNGLRGYTDRYNHDGEYALIGRQGALCGNMNFSFGKAYFTEHAVAVKADKFNDTRFLFYCFGNMNLGQYSGQSAQPGLAVGNLVELKTLVPSKPEQEKISATLTHLDALITLHQRKYERLKNVKKSMLEKMFPHDGANIPEIRFDGFTEAWEQRKLGELVQFSKGTGYSKADLKEFGTPIILYGRLYTKYETVIVNVDTFADAKQGSVYSRGGEVIVPASGETAEDISIASVVEKSGVLLGGDLNIITPSADLDSAFLAISISNGKPHEDMAKMAQGKSVVHLHNTDLEKIDLAYPSHEEQTQISGFFRGIDNLITLHQRKYEKLKQIKKSMLEKMFV